MAAWIGSVLEFYDFALYGTAAALVFPQLFFPPDNAAAATAGSLAIFGAGYGARPLGSFFMGHWGDKYGRKKVLVVTMLLMGFSVFAIGCLPTYNQVGLTAPILLLVLRLLQGIAVSGEAASANTLVLEHSPAHRRGYFTSFTLSGTQGGGILASLVFLLLTSVLSTDQLLSWGWRVPFWLSLVMVVVGFTIRRTLAEPPSFQDEQRKAGSAPRAPLRQVLGQHRGSMVRVFLMVLANTVSVTFSVFALTFATDPAYGNDISKTTMLWLSMVTNLLSLGTIPLFALLSDRFGRKPVYIVGVVGSGVCTWLFLAAITTGNTLVIFGTGIAATSLFFSAYNGTWPAFYNEQFPTRGRVSGVAVATQFGTALTGFVPIIAAALAPPGSNVVLLVGGLVAACCLPAVLAALAARETYKVPLEELGAAPRRQAQ
ncbi:MFS transporter [Streptomyces sp. bgisy091]|uniref:MFS transporter n=1 Tax=Streptomyces sp. bgisy091 TaxID=3413778 RepID=UPI003D738834